MPAPDEVEPFLHFVKPLTTMNCRFMVTGSIAAMLYGEPRLTNDVDLILFLPRHLIKILISRFPLDHYYCPPEEVIAIEAERSADGHFNLVHHSTGFKADVYLVGQDPISLWGLRGSTTFKYAGVRIPVASLEYVIVRKLEYYSAGGSQKHVRDIRAMIQVSGHRLDRETLREKVSELSLQKVWEEVSNQVF
jgi:hypothetical protein